MEFDVTSEFTQEEMFEAVKAQGNTLISKKLIIYFLVLFIIGIVLIIIGTSDFVRMCGWIVTAIMLFLVVVYGIAIYNTRSFKAFAKSNTQLLNGIRYEYSFAEASFTVKYKNDAINGGEVVNYSSVTKHSITDKYLYLYINDRASYIIKISDLSKKQLAYIVSVVK